MPVRDGSTSHGMSLLTLQETNSCSISCVQLTLYHGHAAFISDSSHWQQCHGDEAKADACSLRGWIVLSAGLVPQADEGLYFMDCAQEGGGPALPMQAAAEQAIRATFAHAGQYIALAFVLQPAKAVYADSLAAVQRLLPLPCLRAGELGGAGGE